jgi:putative addiction module component (TIGR02574 family)
MDINLTLNEIKALSIADRIQIVQEILESIAAE